METRMVEQLNEDNRKLRDERKVLYDGEKNERQTGESREIEWGEERVSNSTSLRVSADKGLD
jgi:mitotic spindle assembly checkpoint protein MAD1